MTLYFIVGECVVLLGLYTVPTRAHQGMPMAAAVAASVASVILWPLVVASWIRRTFT